MTTQSVRINPVEPPFASPMPVIAAGLGAAVMVGVGVAIDPRIGIGLLLGCLFIPIVMLSVPVGVLFWIPIIFMERVPAFSFGPTLVALAVACAWLLALPATRGLVTEVIRENRVLFIALAGLLAWTTASVLWATDRAAALADFGWWFAAAATFLIVSTMLSTRKLVIAGCAVFVAGAVASILTGFIPGDVAVRGELAADEAARLAGSLGDPNFLAAGIVPAIALSFGLLVVARSSGRRWTLILALAILFGGLIATASRGGLVALAVMAVAALVFERKRRPQIAGAIAVFLAVAVAGSVYNSSASIDRLRTLETGNGRVDLWSLALKMTADRPATGVGINNYRAEAVRYVREPGFIEQPELIIGSPRVAHNTYLQQLAETGVVGFGLLLLFALAAVAAALKAARTFDRNGEERLAALSRAIAVAQIGVLTTSFFMSNGYDKRIWVVLAFGVAASAQANRTANGISRV